MKIRTPGITKLSAPLAMLALLALPLSAGAEQHMGKGMGKGDPGRGMERMAEKLDLTEEQRSEWQSLHEAHYPRMKELREAMQAQHQALREASEDGFDEEAAEQAAGRLGDLVAESSLERARMHAQVLEILNEEQREKMAEFHDRMRDKMHHGEHEGMKHKKHKSRKDDDTEN